MVLAHSEDSLIMIPVKKTPTNTQALWKQAERPDIAAVLPAMDTQWHKQLHPSFSVQGPALRHLGVTKTPPWTAVNFGLDQGSHCPQRAIILLPRFLRDFLAFKNKIHVTSFPQGDKKPAVWLEVGKK